MPAAIVHVIAAVIFRVAEPVHMLVAVVGVIPVGVVIGDGRVGPIGIPAVHPPAVAVLIAGDIAIAGVGARHRRDHRASAHNGEKRSQPQCSGKNLHRITSLDDGPQPASCPFGYQRDGQGLGSSDRGDAGKAGRGSPELSACRAASTEPLSVDRGVERPQPDEVFRRSPGCPQSTRNSPPSCALEQPVSAARTVANPGRLLLRHKRPRAASRS